MINQSKKNPVAITLSALLIANIAIGVALVEGFSQLDEKANRSELLALKDTIIPTTASLTKSDLELMLMDNPEAIIKSLAKYRFEQEQRDAEEQYKLNKSSYDALYLDSNDPFIGNPNGKHVVVEFIDYNCGYCKKLAPTLKEFVSIDPEAKVIIKEFPIFQNNPTSAYSALVATAVFYLNPSLYDDIHTAFMSKNITREFIDQTLVGLGISKEDLEPHMDRAKKQIERVRALGERLRVTGTPTVFVGSEKLQGGLSAVELKARFTN
ncbi:hypothetical protein FG064_16485 [Vibrio cholerae]|uniref:DsbA family protein n=1 Tax=Vibrio cholerae TaxID=666 RepID=UPI0011D4431E|nr:thioredoxin domain-containing protein [Vibrio cholerae]EGR0468595.1 hypothetical protein [Vibrio cholerae]TXY52024.1 thioredoxin domain-containing protein [Vibrio cholerae]GIB32021.1 putative outer membrane protein [Vibrio cholerae]